MAEGSADVAATIAELQALLLGTESIAGFLYEMAMLAAGTLGGSLSCGITLQTNGRPLTVASSDQLASQVDELQYGLNQGPCLSAARTGQEVRIDDLAADKRWRQYAARALAYGVRSGLAFAFRGCRFFRQDRASRSGQVSLGLEDRFAVQYPGSRTA